jgi:hypothetical protein
MPWLTVDAARISPVDAVADGADPTELLDIEMDEFARMLIRTMHDLIARR